MSAINIHMLYAKQDVTYRPTFTSSLFLELVTWHIHCGPMLYDPVSIRIYSRAVIEMVVRHKTLDFALLDTFIGRVNLGVTCILLVIYAILTMLTGSVVCCNTESVIRHVVALSIYIHIDLQIILGHKSFQF